jgi:hypothetical protein
LSSSKQEKKEASRKKLTSSSTGRVERGGKVQKKKKKNISKIFCIISSSKTRSQRLSFKKYFFLSFFLFALLSFPLQLIVVVRSFISEKTWDLRAKKGHIAYIRSNSSSSSSSSRLISRGFLWPKRKRTQPLDGSFDCTKAGKSNKLCAFAKREKKNDAPEKSQIKMRI